MFISHARATIAALTALAILVTLPLAADASDWKGEEVTTEGVLHVQNPGSPIEPPMTIELDEVYRLGGYSDDPDQIFGVITMVRSDADGNAYLLDSQLNQISIFSPTGEFVDVLGREGEGPGEFRNANGFYRLPNGNWGIMQLAPGRIAQLSPEGEPMSDYPLPSADAGGFIVLRNGNASDDYVFLTMQKNQPGEGKFSMAISLVAIDDEGNVVSEYHADTRELVFADPVIDENVWDTFDRRWAPMADGRVFAVLTNSDYTIKVWNPDGTVDRIIEREYTPLERTAEEIEEVKEIYRRFTAQVPNARIEVSDMAPVVQNIFTRHDGSIWVLTGRGANEQPKGTLGTFDVFDPDGRFVRQVTLKGEGDPERDQYIFEGGRLYVITGFLDAAMNAFAAPSGEEDADEEEAKPLEVICYELDDEAVAMK
jgi:hypothetical protein